MLAQALADDVDLVRQLPGGREDESDGTGLPDREGRLVEYVAEHGQDECEGLAGPSLGLSEGGRRGADELQGLLNTSVQRRIRNSLLAIPI